MSTLIPPPSVVEAKTARRLSRRQGLFAPDLLKTALVRSFIMLRPDIQWKNPVMFTVEVGTVLSILYTIAKAVACVQGHPEIYAPTLLYLIALDLWLFLTVLFANFAEALAEARGKAQAESLRKTRQETPAYKVRRLEDVPAVMELPTASVAGGGVHNGAAAGLVEETASTRLQEGDLVVIEAGQVIPSDGEIVAGIASVDESAITGESAPVVREAGGDRSGVTGGTRVLSDRIVVRITASAGKTFLDRMIALVEGAIRQRTPNEIALSLVLSTFTLVFVIVCVALWPMAYNAEQYMAGLTGQYRQSLGTDVPTLVALLGLPDSDDDRRPAGGHRHRRHGPGAAGQHSGQERQGRRGGRRRGHAAAGQDRHHHDGQPARDAVPAAGRLRGRRGRPSGRPGVRGRSDAGGQKHR